MALELLLLTVARGLVEIAGYALLGQGALALLAGAQRHENPFYRLLDTITRPVRAAVRRIAPRIIVDAHIPLLTFFLLFWLWIALAVAKRHV